MKQKAIWITCLVALSLLAGCAQAGSNTGGGDVTGKVWLLESLKGQAPVAGTFISAEFSTDGRISGSGGCNRYNGQYTVSGSTIQIKQPLASTMMACEQPVMDQETAYFAMLGEAQSFAVEGEQLTLKGSGGTVLAVFKAQSQDLSGTSWQVTGYNNGKQAFVSVVVGTELNATFGKDGTLSGSAGCNNYTGGYKVDGNKISIGPLASTKKFCESPAGTMEQESQFLAAMESAATFSVEGGKLEMRTADDAMAVGFSRK